MLSGETPGQMEEEEEEERKPREPWKHREQWVPQPWRRPETLKAGIVIREREKDPAEFWSLSDLRCSNSGVEFVVVMHQRPDLSAETRTESAGWQDKAVKSQDEIEVF